eukprot:1159475-Pelagomonas_calceolata.AAC.5
MQASRSGRANTQSKPTSAFSQACSLAQCSTLFPFHALHGAPSMKSCSHDADWPAADSRRDIIGIPAGDFYMLCH